MNSSAHKTNFLLFITDQHRADQLGCYGNPIVRTPHIDSIAREGTLFRRFYVACGMCMPNRATLMTGRMPSVHGVRHNGIPLDKKAVTFVDLLSAAGWDTALIGKSHLENFGHDNPKRRKWSGSGGAEPPPFLRDATRDHRDGPEYGDEWGPKFSADPDHRIRTPFYGFNHVEVATDHGDMVGGDYEHWLREKRPDFRSLRGKENADPDHRYRAPQTWRTRVPEELYPSAWVAERSVAWLDRHVQSNAAQPFFLQCSFPDPHHPWTPPGKYREMYRPEDMPVPRSFRQTRVPAGLQAIRDYTSRGGDREGMIAFALDERECQEITALTYGMISAIDTGIGRVLAALKQRNLHENTVVIFTSDHGDYFGDHGVMLKGPLHYEGLVRVPFIWMDPQERRDSTTCDALSGTIDIAPTILARAGIDAYHGIQGFSVLPSLAGGDSPVQRKGILIEQEPLLTALGRTDRFRMRTLISGAWRLTFSTAQDFCELYDRSVDPEEINNLWNDPSVAATQAELMMLLAHELTRIADDSPLPTAIA